METEPLITNTFPSSPKTKSEEVKQSSQFYYKDIFFLVENELFKVHRHYFVEHSPLFRDVLEIAPGDTIAEGASKDKPLKLHGVLRADFAHLLSVVDPVDPLAKCALSQQQWIVVLELAILWRMRDLRQHCIQMLQHTFDSKGMIDKVLMARRYMDKEWLVMAYEKLVKSDDLICADDLDQLGHAEAFNIMRIQAKWMHDRLTDISSRADDINKRGRLDTDDYRILKRKRVDVGFRSQILEIFQHELRRLDSYDIDSRRTEVQGETFN